MSLGLLDILVFELFCLQLDPSPATPMRYSKGISDEENFQKVKDSEMGFQGDSGAFFPALCQVGVRGV